jgi:hypothetical protein
VCFTAGPHPEHSAVAWVPDCAGEPYVFDGATLYHVVRQRFDLAGWLNGGPLRARRSGLLQRNL